MTTRDYQRVADDLRMLRVLLLAEHALYPAPPRPLRQWIPVLQRVGHLLITLRAAGESYDTIYTIVRSCRQRILNA